ncbi:MAG TPA: hypothetical protein VHV78_08795, partial [Gemmatimonadaceae bacterium]|nr:hypothetical protein [Gemmatimonadaceae bacterium]
SYVSLADDLAQAQLGAALDRDENIRQSVQQPQDVEALHVPGDILVDDLTDFGDAATRVDHAIADAKRRNHTSSTRHRPRAIPA